MLRAHASAAAKVDEMDEFEIVRSLLLRIGHGIPANSLLAKSIVEWAEPHAEWLLGEMRVADAALEWSMLTARIAEPRGCPGARPHALQLADELADLLGLEPVDRALLVLMIACDRLPRVRTLATLASQRGHDLPALLGEVAGAGPGDGECVVRRSPVLRLGLIRFVATTRGHVEVEPLWTLERLLDRASTGRLEMIDLLVGKSQSASLGLEDFAGVADADFLVRLLQGAARERASGVNILIHGPPGTGKTEFARSLAAAAGLSLHAVGECDDDGEEPSRWERVHALQIAQRLLGGQGKAVLLFDEMEDFIGESRPSGGDWFAKREGSKVFVNRLLESNAVPVIWTTNAVGNVDNAILRRMSFVLELDLPSRAMALRRLDRVAADEGVVPGAALTQLAGAVPEAATVLRVAARAGRLAEDEDAGARSAHALVRALRGQDLPPGGHGEIDLGLIEADRPVAPLVEAIVGSKALDITLLLAGPPGTGKTGLAHHLARTLDRPLIVKRASDLLSKWVGGTEANIAKSFHEARHQGGVLLLDEVDSLLFDRATARTSWEVTQVNELLTWLDNHPLPVIAATNHWGHLDPAALRRFVFKLMLRPLSGERLEQAFMRFFGQSAPAELMTLTNLTPGDFSVVARQMRFEPDLAPVAIVGRLRAEADAKPERGARIGFQ